MSTSALLNCKNMGAAFSVTFVFGHEVDEYIVTWRYLYQQSTRSESLVFFVAMPPRRLQKMSSARFNSVCAHRLHPYLFHSILACFDATLSTFEVTIRPTCICTLAGMYDSGVEFHEIKV